MMARARFAMLLMSAAVCPAAALAQDHHAHQMPSVPAATPAPAAPMPAMEPGDPAVVSTSPGPELETPPPPEAGKGPPRAADAIWGADAMRASRAELQRMHGAFPLAWFQLDRLEARVGDGRDGYLWDAQGYYGGPTTRLWVKSEGEGRFGGRVQDAEFQALYARAIAPFFDVQAGVRQDVAGPNTTYAVLGIQGLAPYMFELDAAAFLSHRGDLTVRIEAELDQRITQRLIVQPRAELNLAAQDVPQLGVGAGVDTFAVGVRLRYEIAREFAPYIGVEQQWRTGAGARFARATGDTPRSTRLLLGVRAWF
ncbi:copper resistance protein B [Sphingomonas sp. MMS24-J45]|uniref:copper resistance protein B n=1 Tax=Sphingomonas sp. MMS24-J45 TaxID=3238806 RepID=UPI003850C91C